MSPHSHRGQSCQNQGPRGSIDWRHGHEQGLNSYGICFCVAFFSAFYTLVIFSLISELAQSLRNTPSRFVFKQCFRNVVCALLYEYSIAVLSSAGQNLQC